MNKRFKSLFATVITLPASTLAMNRQPFTQLVPFAAGIGLVIYRISELKNFKFNNYTSINQQNAATETTKSNSSNNPNKCTTLCEDTSFNIFRRSLCEIIGFSFAAYVSKSDSCITTTLMGFAGATFMGLLCDCIQSKISKSPLNETALRNLIKSPKQQEN